MQSKCSASAHLAIGRKIKFFTPKTAVFHVLSTGAKAPLLPISPMAVQAVVNPSGKGPGLSYMTGEVFYEKIFYGF